MDLYENTLYSDIKIQTNAQYYSIEELILFVYIIKNEFLISKIIAILMERVIVPRIDNDSFEQHFDFQEPNKNLQNLFKLLNLKKLSGIEEQSSQCIVQVFDFLLQPFPLNEVMIYEALNLLVSVLKRTGVEFFHTLGIHGSSVKKIGILFQSLKHKNHFPQYESKLKEFHTLFFSLFK